VFLPTEAWYGYWNILLGFTETLLAGYYPYWIAFKFPGGFTGEMAVLVVGELAFLSNILINFFCARKDDQGEYITDCN
jgi:hypothetical protein